jgi:hypothetical protein
MWYALGLLWEERNRILENLEETLQTLQVNCLVLKCIYINKFAAFRLNLPRMGVYVGFL